MRCASACECIVVCDVCACVVEAHGVPVRFRFPCFQRDFPDVTGTIDCFEITMERPADTRVRRCCYSTYKANYTCKILVSCCPLWVRHSVRSRVYLRPTGQVDIGPDGTVRFACRAYGGSASDVKIVRGSGWLTASAVQSASWPIKVRLELLSVQGGIIAPQGSGDDWPRELHPCQVRENDLYGRSGTGVSFQTTGTPCHGIVPSVRL
jgi:hypothetical protein